MLGRRLQRLRASAEDGFTITEVIIAIGIFGTVMVMISAMLATGMRGVLLGKQREVATQEATRMLEMARSLSYDNIGLAQGDPSLDSDPAIVDQGGIKRYLVDASTSSYEPVMWATNPSGHPFNPHTTTVTRGSTTLTSYVYVTGVDEDGDGDPDFKRILTRVVWNNDGTQGPENEVRAQSFVDENGLVPVGPPSSGGTGTTTGYTPMSGSTVARGGSISVRSDRGDLVALVDAVAPSLPPVNAVMPTSRGTSTFRAISQTTCTAGSAYLQGGSNSYGQRGVSVTADDDPLSPTPEQPASQSSSGSPGDPVTGLDDVDDLLMETAVGGPIACQATASDSAESLPYEFGEGSGPSTLTLTEDLSGAGLSTSTLHALELSSPSVSQSIDHSMVGGNREVVSSATSSLGGLTVMRVGSIFSQGLVRVGGFSLSATARASEAAASAAPSIATSAPVSVDIYDPASAVIGCTSRNANYCTIAFDPAAVGFSGFDHELSGSVSANLGLTRLDYDLSVEALPPAADPIDGVMGPNGERTWGADYTALSISARLRVYVTVNALLGTEVLLTDTMVDGTLGTASVQGCAGVGCVSS